MPDQDQASNASTQDNTKSRLLTLPAELRNHIYRFVLVRDDPIKLQWKGKYYCFPQGEYHIPKPALLCTSHRVLHETLPIYYGGNAFQVYFSLKAPACTLGITTPDGSERGATHDQTGARIPFQQLHEELWLSRDGESWLAVYEDVLGDLLGTSYRVRGWKWTGGDLHEAPAPPGERRPKAEVEVAIRKLFYEVCLFPLRADGVETLWGTLAELECIELVEEHGVRRWVRVAARQ